MRRFFFNLCGVRQVEDYLGLRFDTELQAFRAAERLAGEIGEVRPWLRDRAWIMLTPAGSVESYSVAINRRAGPIIPPHQSDHAKLSA